MTSSSPLSKNTQSFNIIKRKGNRSTQEWTAEEEMSTMEAPQVREDTPLVMAGGGDIEEGLEPAQLAPIKDGNIKETFVGVLAAITGECRPTLLCC